MPERFCENKRSHLFHKRPPSQLRILATEVFKSLADLNPDFMKSYFTIKEIPYCLRNGNFLKIPPARSTRYGTNSILFRACLSVEQATTFC